MFVGMQWNHQQHHRLFCVYLHFKSFNSGRFHTRVGRVTCFFCRFVGQCADAPHTRQGASRSAPTRTACFGDETVRGGAVALCSTSTGWWWCTARAKGSSIVRRRNGRGALWRRHPHLAAARRGLVVCCQRHRWGRRASLATKRFFSFRDNILRLLFPITHIPKGSGVCLFYSCLFMFLLSCSPPFSLSLSLCHQTNNCKAQKKFLLLKREVVASRAVQRGIIARGK